MASLVRGLGYVVSPTIRKGIQRPVLKSHSRLLICDMAGTTVYEGGGIIYRTIREVLESVGMRFSSQDEEAWHGRDKNEVIMKELVNWNSNQPARRIMIASELMKMYDFLCDDLVNRLEEKYSNPNTDVRLIDPQLFEWFNIVRGRGLYITLNSGYPSRIQEILIERLKMRPHIDGYISSSQVERGRPHPFMIKALMDKFDIMSPDMVVKAGDTVNDILEGKNAHCGQVIGVLSGADTKSSLTEAGADIVVENITDVHPY